MCPFKIVHLLFGYSTKYLFDTSNHLRKLMTTSPLSLPSLLVQWFFSLFRRWLQKLFLAVLASGPIPNHIAFVMDGNRRYAGKKGRPGFEGHYDGFSALRNVNLYTSLCHYSHYPADVGSLPSVGHSHCYHLRVRH